MSRSPQDTPQRPGLKLHPASFPFELLVQWRQMVPVLIGTLLASGSDRWARYFLYALVLASIALAIYALIQALTTRYWIDAQEIVVREGWLFKRVRHMPFERIQNVLLQQSVLHRPFGLFTVRLETGSGAAADADLRVLAAAAARQIEVAVRGLVSTTPDAQRADADERAIVQLNLREVLLAGLVLDRGFLIAAAGLFGLFQLDLPFFDPGTLLRHAVQTVLQWAGGLNAWSLGLVLCAFVLLTKLLTITLSMLQALLLWFGFRLDHDGPRLRADSGLLTRARASATPSRVQVVSIYDGIWLRLLRRRAIGASVSGASNAADGERNLDWLAPIIAEQRAEALIAHALPQLDLSALHWHNLHHATHLRLARRNALLHVLLAAVVAAWSYSLLPLVLLSAVVGQLYVWLWSRLAGYACDGQFLAWRSGVGQRITWVVPIARMAGLHLSSSPFDRRHGTANLLIDTQAPQRAHNLRLKYLPLDVAEHIAARLRRGIE